MGVPPVMVDILPNIAGVDFDQAWNRRVDAVVDPQTDLRANFISAADLMAAKLASGRTQDLADAEALQAAQAKSEKP